MNRTTRLATLTAALTLLPSVALAHPSFNPNQVPSGEAVEAVLVVPHGLGGGMPDGESLPTIELALEHADGVVVEALEVDGWDVADDGEALTWTDAGGATTEPITFPVTLTVDASAGETIYLSAFQMCEGGESFRWIGTPDAEADFPAVLLEVTEGEVGSAVTDDGHGDHEAMSEGEMDDEAMSEGETDHEAMSEDESDHEAMSDGEMDHDGMEADGGAAALEGEDADGGIAIGIVAALVAVALLIAGGLVAVSRGKKAV